MSKRPTLPSDQELREAALAQFEGQVRSWARRVWDLAEERRAKGLETPTSVIVEMFSGEVPASTATSRARRCAEAGVLVRIRKGFYLPVPEEMLSHEAQVLME